MVWWQQQQKKQTNKQKKTMRVLVKVSGLTTLSEPSKYFQPVVWAEQKFRDMSVCLHPCASHNYYTSAPMIETAFVWEEGKIGVGSRFACFAQTWFLSEWKNSFKSAQTAYSHWWHLHRFGLPFSVRYPIWIIVSVVLCVESRNIFSSVNRAENPSWIDLPWTFELPEYVFSVFINQWE